MNTLNSGAKAFLAFSVFTAVFLFYWAINSAFDRPSMQPSLVAVVTPSPSSLLGTPMPLIGSSLLSSAEVNITNNISQDLSAQFVETIARDPEKTIEGTKGISDTNTLINEAVSSFQYKKEADTAKMHVVSDSSLSRVAYLESLTPILGALSKELSDKNMQAAIQSVFFNKYLTAGDAIISKSSTAVTQLYALPVPASLASLHSRLIAQFENIAHFYTILKGYQNDPLMFMAAVEKFPSLVQESASLSQELSTL